MSKTIAHFALDFQRQESVSVADTDEPDRLASLPRQCLVGLRGVWVVAARCCADTIERSFDMSKSKPARAIKARSASKVRSKARHKLVGHHRSRAHSKQMRVLGLLSRPSGATIASIMQCTGWQPHSVRGFLAAVVRKKLGLKLESEKTDGPRVYRIAGGSGDTAAQPSA